MAAALTCYCVCESKIFLPGDTISLVPAFSSGLTTSVFYWRLGLFTFSGVIDIIAILLFDIIAILLFVFYMA